MTRLIELSQGQVTQVDDDIYEELIKFKWSARFHRNYANGGAYTASTNYREPKAQSKNPEKKLGSKRGKIYLHSFVYWLKTGDKNLFSAKLSIDHIDGNPLNNQFENLRLVSCGAQAVNQRLKKTNLSGLKGVGWYKASQKWQARLMINGKAMFLGRFDCKLEAWLVYQEAHRLHYGCEVVM